MHVVVLWLSFFVAHSDFAACHLLQDLRTCAGLPHKKGKHTRTVVSDTAAHVTGATISESLTNALVGVVVSHKVSEEPFREKVDTCTKISPGTTEKNCSTLPIRFPVKHTKSPLWTSEHSSLATGDQRKSPMPRKPHLGLMSSTAESFNVMRSCT